MKRRHLDNPNRGRMLSLALFLAAFIVAIEVFQRF